MVVESGGRDWTVTLDANLMVGVEMRLLFCARSTHMKNPPEGTVRECARDLRESVRKTHPKTNLGEIGIGLSSASRLNFWCTALVDRRKCVSVAYSSDSSSP